MKPYGFIEKGVSGQIDSLYDLITTAVVDRNKNLLT